MTLLDADKPKQPATAGDRSPSKRIPLAGLRSRFGRRGWLILAASLVVVAVLVYWLWPSKKTAAEEEAADIVVSVRVAQVERGTIAAEQAVLGTVVPREQAVISPKINAQIKSMALLKNKQVRAGDVLATLESRDLQSQRAEAAAALEEAQANLRLLSGGTIPESTVQDEKAIRDARANVANARATYNRRKALYDSGGISKKDLEASQLALTTAENDLNAAEAAARLHQTATNPGNRAAAASRVKQAQDRLANLDTQLSYAVIRAPFSGVITDQFQFEGEYAAAGAKLLAIADVSEVIVKAPVSDTVASQLKVGDRATIIPQELPDTSIPAKISLVSRSTDPQSRSVEVWIDLKNEDGRLRAASAAKVILVTNTATDVLLVPASAVTLKASTADEGTVMVVDENSIAHETEVRVGIRTPDRMEITSGLKEGETVVVEGNYALPDGTRVEVASEGEGEHEFAGDGGPTDGAATTDNGAPSAGGSTQSTDEPNGNKGAAGRSSASGRPGRQPTINSSGNQQASPQQTRSPSNSGAARSGSANGAGGRVPGARPGQGSKSGGQPGVKP